MRWKTPPPMSPRSPAGLQMWADKLVAWLASQGDKSHPLSLVKCCVRSTGNQNFVGAGWNRWTSLGTINDDPYGCWDNVNKGFVIPDLGNRKVMYVSSVIGIHMENLTGAANNFGAALGLNGGSPAALLAVAPPNEIVPHDTSFWIPSAADRFFQFQFQYNAQAGASGREGLPIGLLVQPWIWGAAGNYTVINDAASYYTMMLWIVG